MISLKLRTVVFSIMAMAAILAGAAPKELKRLQVQMPWIPPL